jgi:YgiT-type zinc finger domain-containing protein
VGNSNSEEEKEMKGLITICPECQVKTELREITVEFERKGIRATMSGIPAMVCPNCGEEYIPGEIGGDVIDVVSRAIDYLEALLKRSEVRRKELLPDQPTPSPKRLELALAS